MNVTDNLVHIIVSNKRWHIYAFFLLVLMMSVFMDYHFKGAMYLGDDFNFHYIRISVLMDAIREGTFPNYLNYKTLEGYGYYANGFYSDFLLIPFAWIGVLLNLDPFQVFRLIIGAVTILSGLFTYKATNRIFDNPILAFIVGILFSFCVYKLCNSYYRAALGELLAMSFIPLVMHGAYELIKGDCKKWYIFSIGFCLLILSHLLTPVLVGIVLLVIMTFSYKSFVREPKRIYFFILSGVVAIILSSCFLFPMVEQLLSDTFYINSDKHAELLKQAPHIMPKVILKGMFMGITSGEGFGLGVLLTIVILLRIFLFRKEHDLRIADIFLVVGLIFTASLYLYPWSVYPFSKLGFIQFPWRFYSVISLLFSVSGGVYLFSLLKTDKRRILVGIPFIVIMNLIVIMCYSEDIKKPVEYIEPKPSFSNNYLLSGAEYLPEKVVYPYRDFIRDRGDLVVANSEIKIENFERNKSVLTFNVSATFSDKLELPLIYYKGYKALLNGKKINVSQSQNGLVMIDVDKPGKIEVWFAGTLIQNIGLYASIIGTLLLIVYIYFQTRKKRFKNA